MVTLVAPSRYDGRPAFQLVYRAFRSYCSFIHMVDEVRRLKAGQYLGIGTLASLTSSVTRPVLFADGASCAVSWRYRYGAAGFEVESELPTLSDRGA